MVRFSLRSTPVLVAALLLSANAFAASVTWTVNAELGNDADQSTGTLTGTFDYDADTGSYSNIDLSATDNYSYYFQGEFNDYSPGTPEFWLEAYDSTSILLHISTWGPAHHLELNWEQPLTNLGGAHDLSVVHTSYEEQTRVRTAISGLVSASVVPIPAAVWLFGSALVGLGWLRRKQAI